MIYTIRMFHNDSSVRYVEEEFQANCGTEALNKAATIAQQNSVPHFNVNVGHISREEPKERFK